MLVSVKTSNMDHFKIHARLR